MDYYSLGLTAQESESVAIEDVVTRTRVWASKIGLTPMELLEAVGKALSEGSPLSPDRKKLLRECGMDEQVYRALNKGDGGKAYNALMKKRGAGKEATV